MSTSTTTSLKSCGQRRERGHDRILREPLDDSLLVEHLLAAAPRPCSRGSSRPPPAAVSSGVRCSRRPRSTLRFVRIRRSQARRFVPGVYDCQLRNALAYVSCTRSSASSRVATNRARPGTPGRRARGPLPRTAPDRGPPPRSGAPRPARPCSGSPTRATVATSLREGETRAERPLFPDRRLRRSRARGSRRFASASRERRARRDLVVPRRASPRPSGSRSRLEPGVTPSAEASRFDAPLAAHAETWIVSVGSPSGRS